MAKNLFIKIEKGGGATMGNYNKKIIKRKVYEGIVRLGLKVLSKIFPNIHMKVPLKPSDRFLEYPFVFRHLPLNKSAEILDVGCAGNFLPLTIAALGYKTTAVDIRSYEIVNNIKFDNFNFLQRDILKDKFEENSFDIVCCISVLEHIGLEGRYGSIKDAKGDINMAKEIWRILRPGGFAILTVPYGIGEVFPPYHRIYNLERVREIEKEFRTIEEEFYYLDNKGDWLKCSAEDGQLKRGSIDKSGLALLYLRKE